jgi:hypothetical protein
MTDPDLADVHLGRLMQLKLKRSSQARRDALDTLQRTPKGLWRVRIGGRMRGTWREFPSQEAAEHAVHAHYNDQMLAFVQREGKRS